MKNYLLFFYLLFTTQLCVAQNVGIGISSPITKLDVNGLLTLRGGTPGTDKVLTSDATGTATWQNSSKGSGFLVYRDSNSIAPQFFPTTTEINVDFASVYNDDGANYNTTNDYYTCPTDGFYHFDFTFIFKPHSQVSFDGYLDFGFSKNGSNLYELRDRVQAVFNGTNYETYETHHSLSINIKLNANDKIYVHASQNTGFAHSISSGIFSGYRLY